jgi:hypothetical protein
MKQIPTLKPKRDKKKMRAVTLGEQSMEKVVIGMDRAGIRSKSEFIAQAIDHYYETIMFHKANKSVLTVFRNLPK